METNTYPLLPLRGINAFPNLTLHFDVGREKSVQALRAALEKEQNLFLTSQKDMEVSNPEEADLYSIGTMCKVQQVLALPGDHIRVLVEGLYRAKIVRVLETEPYMLVRRPSRSSRSPSRMRLPWNRKLPCVCCWIL